MTEERKKYLDNISKEERAIRGHIEVSKHRIKLLKSFFVEDQYDVDLISEEKQALTKEKTLIKVLKKQLPAPRKEIDIGLYWAIFNCPICRTTTPIYAGYCLCCGQKLR